MVISVEVRFLGIFQRISGKKHFQMDGGVGIYIFTILILDFYLPHLGLVEVVGREN